MFGGYFNLISRLFKDETFGPIQANEMLDVGDTFFPDLKKELVHFSPSPDMYPEIMRATTVSRYTGKLNSSREKHRDEKNLAPSNPKSVPWDPLLRGAPGSPFCFNG